MSSAGQVKSVGHLNFEWTPTYKVTIKATDPSGLSTEREFTIHVTNVNEEPYNIELTDVPVSVVGDGFVGNLSVADYDGVADTHTFSVVSAMSGGIDYEECFSVEDGSELYANPSCGELEGRTYQITVRATDVGGLFVDETFAVTVDEYEYRIARRC